MSSSRLRRIAKEIADIHADKTSQIKANVVGKGDDLTHIKGSFEGPPGTPYQNGTFVVDIRVPNEYPFRPPVMKFDTKIWHPNVSSQTGAICLDTLSSAWSPVLTIKSALLSLQSLLSTPEPNDPQDAEVATMLIQKPKEFERRAKQWTINYAGAPGGKRSRSRSSSLEELSMGSESFTASRHADFQRARLYGGYSEVLVGRFERMGFETSRIVEALNISGVDAKNGRDYELDEHDISEVMTSLLGD